jgi:uncharacterized protein YndB with AHSA1/START domain
MKFSTTEDIRVPISVTFEMLTSFEQFERAAMRRGAEVQRTDKIAAPGVGMGWRVLFPFRGKEREVEIVVERFDGPDRVLLVFSSDNLKGAIEVDFLALSRSDTRLSIVFEVLPRTLPARVMIQTMTLAKSSLGKRFNARIGKYLRDMEEDYQRQLASEAVVTSKTQRGRLGYL